MLRPGGWRTPKGPLPAGWLRAAPLAAGRGSGLRGAVDLVGVSVGGEVGLDASDSLGLGPKVVVGDDDVATARGVSDTSMWLP